MVNARAQHPFYYQQQIKVLIMKATCVSLLRLACRTPVVNKVLVVGKKYRNAAKSVLFG